MLSDVRLGVLIIVAVAVSGCAFLDAMWDAKIGRWPGQVALRFKNKQGLSLYVCGGTLVCPRWVLTAAHCVHDVVIGYGQKTGPYSDGIARFAEPHEQAKGLKGEGALEVASGTDD